MIQFNQQHTIHPEKQEELQYWANRWGISVRDLTNAIIDTGYLNTVDLKNHFRKKEVIFFSPGRILKSIGFLIRAL